MNLQFKDVARKNIDGKLVYDLTIQDLDGEIAEGRELPFSYIFGQEPTSVLESYINDHIDELKAIVIDENTVQVIWKNQDMYDKVLSNL